jgi:general secretion pathway protein A
MYCDHYGLKERPFTHAPGARFFAANDGVNEAVTRLMQVMTGRDAIALVTGGPGVGKSTLVERAAAELGDGVTVVRVDLRYGEAEDIYGAMLLALDENSVAARPAQALAAVRRLMARGQQRLVLSLDVGGMTADVARHLLRLANAAGEHGGQLNMVLMGPHALHQQLDLPALMQLRQRIAFRYRVRPLTLADTDRYIRHQVQAVGGDPITLVSANLPSAVFCYVAGVPRLINTLVDATLGEGVLQKDSPTDASLVRRAAEGLGWKPLATAAGTDRSQKATAARKEPAKIAAIPTAVASRPEASGSPTVELLAPSEMTLQMRRSGTSATADVAGTGQFPAISLHAEPRPDAANKASADAKLRAVRPAPVVPMDDTDTGATGMLRLQDLDERFAETIFGNDAEGAR